jgi:predicted double-glycine peptidase
MPAQAIPLLQQELEYSCGAASLASILIYWQVWSGQEDELYSLLNTDMDGTRGEKLIEVAQSFGLTAWSESELWIDDLRRYLLEGCTLILSIQAEGVGWEEGHYVVLAEVQADKVVVMDPAWGEYRTISIVELMTIWHDYDDQGRHDYQGAIILKKSLRNQAIA